MNNKQEESSHKREFSSVFDLLKKHYKPVPLEAFGRDAYKTLVSTLLSSRTNDDTTLSASLRLFRAAPTLKKLRKLRVESISKLIYPVGFYQTKAKQLKKLAEILLSEYGGRIPQNREELIKLPGVGRKTANLVLNRAFKVPAISVDTHVHRISNLLGWVNTKHPEETERELMKILPKRYWKDINRLMVSLGRQYRSIPKLKNFLRKNGL